MAYENAQKNDSTACKNRKIEIEILWWNCSMAGHEELKWSQN